VVDDKRIFLLTAERKEKIMSEISVNKRELMVIIYLMERAKRSFDGMLDFLEVGMTDDDLEAYGKPLSMVDQCISRLKRLTD
jgi:hypothetical protein